MLKRMLLVSVLMVTALAPAGWAGSALPPVAMVRKLSAYEIRDGAAHAIWERSAAAAGFVLLKVDRPTATQRTEVRLAYDDRNLYIGFKCFESQMAKLKAEYKKPDDYVWRDDSTTVLLDPSKGGEQSYHMSVNVAGTKFDSRGEGAGATWNGEWSVEISRQEGAWTCLYSIPFASLGKSAPRPNEMWTANFGRREIASEELTSWAPVDRSFQEREKWGSLVFGDADAPIVLPSISKVSSPGRHPLSITVSNPLSFPVKLRAETICGGQPMEKIQWTAAPGESVHNCRFACPQDGKQQLSVAVYGVVTGRLLARTTPVHVDIPSYGARMEVCKRMLSTLTPYDKASTDRKAAAMDLAKELEALAEKAQGDDAAWAALGSKVDALEKTAAVVRAAVADKDGRGYAVGTETALRKLLRDRPFDGKVGEPAKLDVAREEFESVQVVVLAGDKELKDVAVSVSDLTGPDGAVIPAGRIGLNLVEWVETKKPKYEVDYVGWWPDPLMEMAKFDVAPGAMRPVWVTVHPPDAIAGGLYTGYVTVKPANAAETRVKLEVRVRGFTLPNTMHMKTAFAIFPHEIGAWWRGVDINRDTWRGYYEFLLDHRLSPTNIYTPKPLPEKPDIPFCVEHGMNSICLAYTHNKDAKNREALAEMLLDYTTFLKDKGWQDMAYLYGFDEIKPDKYSELKDMYGWVKQAMPDLLRMCTVAPRKELKGYIDIWVPVTDQWNQKVAEEYTKGGDEVWWYVCCVPPHPYPNFFIDYPAIDPRVIFWMNWKYQIPGFLYYAINLWENNRLSGERWPDVPWKTHTFEDYNGDGVLVYPGRNGRLLSCIRLESIRDGIEDYEYFYILNDTLKKAEKSKNADPAVIEQARKVLKVRGDIVTSPSQYTLDPALLLGARAEVAELIEKLSK